MISNVPATSPQYLASASQQQELKSDLSTLSQDNVGDYFKGLALRGYIQKIIAKNEKQKVTTDVSIIDLQSQKAIVGHNLDTEQFAASVNKYQLRSWCLWICAQVRCILTRQ